MKRRSTSYGLPRARRLAGVLGLLLLASAGTVLAPAGAAAAAGPMLLAQTDPPAGPSADQLAAEAAARAAQQPQTDAGSGSAPAAAPPASSPTGDSGGGSFCFPWPGGACIDLGKWLRDTADSIVTGLLSGLAQAVGGFLNWFIGQFNFVSRTPEDLSYRNPTVLRFTAATRAIAFGLLGAVVMVSGFNVLFRPALGSTYHGAMELLPRLALGGILIFSSSWWCQLAIDTNNALCGLVGTQALQDLLRLTQLNDPGVVVALLIYLAMFVLLLLQQLMRLALVDVLLVLAPLAALCWILPQTYGWARLWGSLFVGTVFAQFVQVLALTLGANVFIARYEQRRGTELGSELLVADAAHTRADVFITTGVLASVLFARGGWWWLDPAVAIMVAVAIVAVTYRILARTVPVLVDQRAIPTGDIQATAQAVRGVKGAYAIRSRGPSDLRYAEVTIAVDRDAKVEAAHQIADEVEERLKRELGLHQVTVHIEPC